MLPWRWRTAAHCRAIRIDPRSLFPQQGHKHERHAEGGNIPDQRADEGHAKGVEWKIGESRREIENRTGFCKRVVAADGMRGEDQSREQGKGLRKIAQSPVEPTSDAGERRNLLIPRAGGPAIAMLQAGRVGPPLTSIR